MVLTRVLGRGAEADAYSAAFLLPDLLNYFLAGGALSIAFIPFYTRLWRATGMPAADRFLAVIFGTTGALAIAATSRCGSGAIRSWRAVPGFSDEQTALTARLTRILLPAQIFFVTGGVLRGALMARGHFVSQSLAPVIYNLAIIAGGLALGTRIGAEGFAWGALVGAIVGRVRHRVARDPPRAGDPARSRGSTCATPRCAATSPRCCRSWPASRSAPRTTGSDAGSAAARRGAIASLGYAGS
jgi:putative peptidoglycan lipid II flippase